MTSIRQIEANRRNALRSTGPATEDGRRRSRRNAVRHGLCAETVVAMVEDVQDYRGFEAAVIADYDARTAVERELVLRLASLLWRLRRATAIEIDLLRIQAEILHDLRFDQAAGWSQNMPPPILRDRSVHDEIFLRRRFGHVPTTTGLSARLGALLSSPHRYRTTDRNPCTLISNNSGLPI